MQEEIATYFLRVKRVFTDSRLKKGFVTGREPVSLKVDIHFCGNGE